jgi:hypothetical protein
MSYYNINEVYGEKFYQVPKVFMTNEKYRKLSSDSKLAYGILKDRFSLSVKNEWYDEEGRIYFIYSQEALTELFSCSRQTAVNIKKALIKANLLEAKRMGQGQADRLYLLRPEVTKDDIYLINKAESLGRVEKSKNKTSRSLENGQLEVHKIDTINTNINNTNKNNIKDFVNKESFTENDLLNITDSFYNELAPGRWSKDQWLKLTEKLVGEVINSEGYKDIKNMTAYLRGCLNQLCYHYDYKRGRIKVELPSNEIPFYNWLEEKQ